MVGFPLLLIPLAIYNIVAWLMPGVPLTGSLVGLTLPSGVEWQITLSDILLALGVLLLLLEIFKGARPGSKYLTDHLLSFVVFGGSAAEFVLLPKFGTSTFLLLSLMAMVDFFGGIALSARRPSAASLSRRARKEVESPKGEQGPEPELAAPVPSAAELSAPRAAFNAAEPSPSVPSPDLQPGAGPSPSPDTPPR